MLTALYFISVLQLFSLGAGGEGRGGAQIYDKLLRGRGDCGRGRRRRGGGDVGDTHHAAKVMIFFPCLGDVRLTSECKLWRQFLLLRLTYKVLSDFCARCLKLNHNKELGITG